VSLARKRFETSPDVADRQDPFNSKITRNIKALAEGLFLCDRYTYYRIDAPIKRYAERITAIDITSPFDPIIR